MSEHPILFTSEMVRAVLEGRKVQVRRVITERYCFCEAKLTRGVSVICLEKAWTTNDRSYLRVPYLRVRYRHVKDADFKWDDCGSVRTNPPYKPGDVLWVKEDHARWSSDAESIIYQDEPEYEKLGEQNQLLTELARTSQETSNLMECVGHWVKVPARRMPRWACRIFLAVKNVRVERGHTKRGCGWNANIWVWTIDFEKKENAE